MESTSDTLFSLNEARLAPPTASQLSVDEITFQVRPIASTSPWPLRARFSSVTAGTPIAHHNHLKVYQLSPLKYESRLELVVPFKQTYSLFVTESRESACQWLHSPLANAINTLAPLLANRKNLHNELFYLIRCYRDNPDWNMAHYAAYLMLPSYLHQNISLQQLEDCNNRTGMSPLHIAATLSDLDSIKLMLATGMDVFMVDIERRTVMHYAMLGSTKVISFLVQMPAFYEQLRHVDSKGCTPLHLACLANNAHNVQRAMLQGLTSSMLTILAPVPTAEQLGNWRDASPIVPFSVQEVNDCFDQQSICQTGCPLHWVISYSLLSRLIRTQQFKVSLRNTLGETPLIVFVKRLNLPLGYLPATTYYNPLSWILKLLKAGGRINSMDEQGNTALHWAALNGNVTCAQMLLVLGARVNLRNKSQQSALHMAASQVVCPSALNGSTSSLDSAAQSSLNSNPQSSLVNFGLGRFRKPKEPQIKESKFHLEIVSMLKTLEARPCLPGIVGCNVHCARLTTSQTAPQTSNLKDKQCFEKNIVVQLNETAEAIIEDARRKLKRSNFQKQSNQSQISSQRIPKSNQSIGSQKSENETKKISKSSERKSDSSNGSLTTVATAQSTIKSMSSKRCATNAITNTTMLVLDGGYNDGSLRPLVQTIILNELETYLTRPLHEYFQVIAASGYGSITGALLATRRSAVRAIDFFIRLRESFKKPIMTWQEENTRLLDLQLTSVFKEKKLSELGHKRLLLATTFIKHDPVLLQMIDSQDKDMQEMLLWEACRNAGAGIGVYKVNKNYYDGSLISANPTVDSLAHYLDTSMSAPLELVVSVGGGLEPVITTVDRHFDTNHVSFIDPTWLADFFHNIKYYLKLKDVLVKTMFHTDGYVSERSRVWCQALEVSYARVNVTLNKTGAKKRWVKLKKALDGEGTEWRSGVRTRDDQLLLQVLWSAKVELHQKRHQLSRLARLLKVCHEQKE